MPYKALKVKGGYVVVNANTGKRMNKKPHKTLAKAKAHLRALHANVKK